MVAYATPDVATLLNDLFELRAELESLDLSGQAWGVALSAQDRRQRRQELEIAVQEKLAHLGAAVLDTFTTGDAEQLWTLLNARCAPQGRSITAATPAPQAPSEAPVSAPKAEAPARAKVLGRIELPTKPEPPPEPAPTPTPSVPVTEAMIDDLAKRWSGRGSSEFVDDLPTVVTRQQVIERAFEILGATPDAYRTKGNVRDEVRHIAQLLDEEVPKWAFATDELNGALTHWVTSRARAVQDAIDQDFPTRFEDRELIRVQFTRLTRHVADTRPCFVYGLSLHHQPRYGASWIDDSRYYEDALNRWFDPDPDDEDEADSFDLDDAIRRLTLDVRAGLALDAFIARIKEIAQAGFKPEDELRLVHLGNEYEDIPADATPSRYWRAVEANLEQEALRAEDESQNTALPEDWPYFSYTRGKHAVIVGGDPRPVRLPPLQEAFGFASIDWRESGPRQIDALIRKMHQGGIDLVIVLRAFSKHRVSGPIFEARKSAGESGCEVILADAYGIQQLRQGVERFFASREDIDR